jgi:hypothetical protein
VRRFLRTKVDPPGRQSVPRVQGLAALEYLLGEYRAAEPLLRRVVEDAGRNVRVRVDAEVVLALVYLQTNRYSEARGLFTGLDGVDLPLWELMKSFGDEQPYRIEWGRETEVALPFVQTTWELPCVRLRVSGLEVEARIDTGGEQSVCMPS